MRYLALLIIFLVGACSDSANPNDQPPTAEPTPQSNQLTPNELENLPIVTNNTDWTPIEQDFDGVLMMLVPAGCFMMGNDDGAEHEQPSHEQCFDAPFWIDKYEVTQAQFASWEGVKARDNAFIGDDRPVERITWAEMRDYCQLRGARLPTEAEWEYAARGVDSWLYPWGVEWNADKAVWGANSNEQTADVGSRPNGASWVGALDMIGNVWEWTSSLYGDYPYDMTDGREQNTDGETDVYRVFRGGAWYDVDLSYPTTVRDGGITNYSEFAIGGRCVRDVLE